MLILMTRARVMMVIVLGCLAVGCAWWSPSPADSARHFIESQVTADTPAAVPAGDLAGRVALDYARALARQGSVLRYGVETSTIQADETRTVIAVTPVRADGTAPPALRFHVVLAKDDAGGWRVRAWSAAD